jgi:Icc-related predicted phosphoesterase
MRLIVSGKQGKRGENTLMRIIAAGDIHMDPGDAASIPGIDSADHLIITGDITNYGSSLDAETVLNRLRTINSSILCVAGNLDQPDVARYLEDIGISLHGRGVIIEDLGIMGLGGSNYTPFNTPYEFSEEELSAFLSSGFAQIKSAKNFILVSHTPPVLTKTDRLANGKHVGSMAVRTFIEEKQPLLCLTGHIHESRGQDYIGRTLVLNPGMMKHGGYIEAIYENGVVSAALNP